MAANMTFAQVMGHTPPARIGGRLMDERVAAASLGRVQRWLVAALAAVFGLLGAVLFLAPRWSSGRFAWETSAFVTMTIGGWCLGTAWIAFRVARDPAWDRSIGLLAYLWAFGILQAVVAVWFRSHIQSAHVLTWPYLVCIGLGVVVAAVGIVELIRAKPDLRDGPPSSAWLRTLVWTFAVGVGVIAAVAFLHPSSGATRRVFPERISPFTIRAFGAFFGSLALGALALLPTRSLRAVYAFAVGGMGFIVPILAASLVYLSVFDLGAHPFQLAYIGAYVVVGVVTTWFIAWARRREEIR